MSSRKTVSKNTEAEVLIQSARRCCVCFGLHNNYSIKSGQIAHLDRNNQNNYFDNLAFLCFEHHDQYDTTTSQSKGWSLKEIKKYRNLLYQEVDKRRAGKLTVDNEVSQLRGGATGFLIGERLREIRIELGLSSSEFVEAIGFSSEQKYLKKEDNLEDRTTSEIFRIQEVTGVSSEWLKHGTQPKCEVEALWWWESPSNCVKQLVDDQPSIIYVTVVVPSAKNKIPFVGGLKDLQASARGVYLQFGNMCNDQPVPLQNI